MVLGFFKKELLFFVFTPKNQKALRSKTPQGPKKPKENYSLGAAGCSPAGVSVVVVVVVVVSSFVTSLAASSAA
jgi:hypothetical protein